MIENVQYLKSNWSKQMRNAIVIIDDQKEHIDSLQYLLEKGGLHTQGYLSAEEYFKSKRAHEHCVFLIDLNFPGINGAEIIRSIRIKDKLSSIFIISACNTKDEIVKGLKCGADDYITKPFSSEELLVRVKNAHQKISLVEDNLMSIGIKLIPEANSVMKSGVTINLTSREFNIFYHLYMNSEAILSRDEFINEFKNEVGMTSRNIDVHIFSLRKKLKSIQIGIETVRGSGYRIIL